MTCAVGPSPVAGGAATGDARRRPDATARAMDPTTPKGMVLRTGTEADAATAADLHAGAISEGFLALLGPQFLRLLYRRIVRAPDSFLIIAEDDAGTLGFLAGSVDVAGLYRAFLWRDGLVAVVAAAGRLVRSWRRVLETLRHGRGDTAAGAELLAVAVAPPARGRGVGALLVRGFLAEVERRGHHSAHVVVAAHNDNAVALYRRAGFAVAEQFELHAGTTSLVMHFPAPTGRGR